MSHVRKRILSRRLLLQGAAGATACSLFTGCGYSSNLTLNALPGGLPASPTIPAGGGSLTVTTDALGSIPTRFMGLSYEKLTLSYAYFHASNHDLIALFRRLGEGVLRIGGGSVDEVLFTSGDKGTHLQVTPLNITVLAAFLQATGWLCLYGVNFATSTPALAAEEVGYVVAALGSNLLGIEIGNEPDEYSVAGHFFVGNWTFQDFLARWDLFRTAIVETAPNVPVTAQPREEETTSPPGRCPSARLGQVRSRC